MSGGNLFSYHKTEHILEKLNKINGLKDITISTIKYIPELEILIVGYENGNIDLILPQEIVNLPEIKQEIISGGKCINKIDYFDSFAYLSTDFGIVVLDLEKRRLKKLISLEI